MENYSLAGRVRATWKGGIKNKTPCDMTLARGIAALLLLFLFLFPIKPPGGDGEIGLKPVHAFVEGLL